MRKKSEKIVKELAETLLPYEITFPVTVEGSVNGTPYKFKGGELARIESFSVYQAIVHSSYGKYFEILEQAGT